MVFLRISQDLKEFLKSKGKIVNDVAKYDDIREFLIGADKEIIRGCEFVFPREEIPKKSENIKRIEERRKEREYQNMTSNVYVKPKQGNVQEYREGMSMGMSFISILFLGMLSGYYLGKYYFAFDFQGSMLTSLVVTVISLYVEVMLYVLKSNSSKKIKIE